jgi:Methyltransferase domain
MNDLRELEPQAARQAFNPDHTAVHQDDPFLDYLHIEFCPCCGAPAAEAEPRIASSPPAETLCAEQHTNFVSGYTRARVFFTYFECPSCSAMFCPTYYRQSQLDGLYGRQAENMFYLPLESRKRTQEDYIDLLRRHSRMAGNFLEIGPDIGLFASSFGRLGAFDQFWLYEPNRDVHEPLAGNFRGMRHTISTSIFRAADVPAQSVSTAAMIHVLDHLLEPAQFLREIASSMEPDGVVFIVTHDCASLLARVLQGRWPPYTLQHPQLFFEALHCDAAAGMRVRGGRDRQDHQLFPPALSDPRRFDGLRAACQLHSGGRGAVGGDQAGQYRHRCAQAQIRPACSDRPTLAGPQSGLRSPALPARG